MEPQQNDYHISFFKPTTDVARLNRNIVVMLVCIWTVAIFGFQIALKVFEKPVPEPAYLTFESVWDEVSSGTASQEDLQLFAQVSLSVLGKNFIEPQYRQALDNGLSWSVMELAGPDRSTKVKQKVTEFESMKASIEMITDPAYVEQKNELAAITAPLVGLPDDDVRTTLISVELHSAMMDALSEDSKALIPEAMDLYLIHNQSFLTDARLLGFPFHYFYTAIFLLVLFVGLCWLYCKRTDRRNALLGIEE